MPTALRIDTGAGPTTGVVFAADPGRRLQATLVLAHGAGADQHSSFMTAFASGLAARGVDVLTFNFPYAEAKRRAPDRPPVLEACFRAAVTAATTWPECAGHALFVGGKSMGGRIASHLAAAADTATALRGLVLLGYPLHPPGQPDRLRVAHLPAIRVPVLCLQGSRDPFGTPGELGPHLRSIAGPVTLHAVEGGDHSLAPPRRTGVSAAAVCGDLQDRIAAWVAAVAGPPEAEPGGGRFDVA